MTKSIIQEGIEFLMKKYGVRKHGLKYIGYTDCRAVCEGAKLLQYNIINSKHKCYKSTVAYRYGW